MLEKIFKAFSFIKESLSLVAQDADVIKPSFYSIFVGAIFTMVSVLILFFLESKLHFGIGLYILVFFVFLGDYVISYFFSGMTAFFVCDFFKDGDATMSEAWTAIPKNIVQIFFLAIISAIVNIITGILRGYARKDRSMTGSFSVIIGFIEKSWTIATYFIIPAIVIEDRSLKDSLERATYIIKRNLLPIGVGEIAVGFVTGILSIISIIIAIAIGVSLIKVIEPLLAILMISILIVIIIAFSMYVTTAYHTCLFLWARNIEGTGIQGGSIKPPAPIANALGII